MAVDMKRIVLFLAGSLWLGLAQAESESLMDPTRPPEAFVTGAPGAGQEEGLRLQSVLMPQSGRPTAIISGQVVRVGEEVGGARLLKLTETEAVLKGPNGVERLFLTPDATKTSDVGRPTASAKEKRKKP